MLCLTLFLKQVHVEFSKLFEMKLANFLQELLSVILTPFILCFSLPRSASAIIDFFREFTIHVDGIGYVCSFAVFDFKRQGKVCIVQVSWYSIFLLLIRNGYVRSRIRFRMRIMFRNGCWIKVTRWKRVFCISK
jgi:hypothetical protein